MHTIEDIKKALLPIFEEEPITRVVLFGSYAKGTAGLDSDVDLVVETEPHIYGFGVYGIFGRMGEELQKMNLEYDIIHRMDVIEDNEMGAEITKIGRVIFEEKR